MSGFTNYNELRNRNTSEMPFRGVIARRLCAFLTDMLLITLASWTAAIGIFILGIITLGMGFLLLHIIPIMPFIYFTLLLPNGGTIGQRLFQLEARQDSELSRRPTYTESLVWSLLLYLTFALAFLPFLLVFTNPRHRAGHDILSGLAIIRTS